MNNFEQKPSDNLATHLWATGTQGEKKKKEWVDFSIHSALSCARSSWVSNMAERTLAILKIGPWMYLGTRCRSGSSLEHGMPHGTLVMYACTFACQIWLIFLLDCLRLFPERPKATERREQHCTSLESVAASSESSYSTS